VHVIFRQLFDPQSSTYTYLLADSATLEAVLVDPVFEQARRDEALVKELGLRLVFTLETHVHADHVTGAWLHRKRLGSKIAVAAASGAEGADRYLADGERIDFGRRYLTALATPGHTAGCLTYVLDNEAMAFTGDALLIRGCGRTDFQQGDAHTLFASVRERIFALPGTCLIYPGHDYRGLTCSSVAEEKRHNPRLAEGVGEGDFVGYMTHLGLPHPKQMDIAVPANLRCGRPEKEAAPGDEPDWGPLSYTFAGIWEVQPGWLEENLNRVQVVDVREPGEYTGPLGHIPGAKLIPLGTLAGRAKELAGGKPVVTVCRSGARSAQATVILRKEGVGRAANLAGGMLRWRAQGFAVEGGRE
jgi:glyoxylase-like metal-dependent hydrolase (beta-lactamase superfamily II)/rhodanese-related sulfurtransferase